MVQDLRLDCDWWYIRLHGLGLSQVKTNESRVEIKQISRIQRELLLLDIKDSVMCLILSSG